jgi:hypothetical protein
LAFVQCTYLTRATTTTTDGLGRTVMPIGQGAVRFPGPPGVTYAPGVHVDCGMTIDSQESWRITPAPDPGTLDLGAVTMHEGGHMLGLSHSTIGLSTVDSNDDATMIPFADATSNLRSLHLDDVGSLLRSYLRVNSLDPVTGGFARIRGQFLKNPACDTPAFGVSVRVHPNGQALEAAAAQETFSASFLRRAIPGQSRSGQFDINVLPGVQYALAAILLSNEGGSAYWSFRFNLTTALSNATTPGETILDNLATVGPLLPGETVAVGNIGVLGCSATGGP